MWLALFLACGSADGTTDDTGPLGLDGGAEDGGAVDGGADGGTSSDDCADTVDVTWDGWGEGFFVTWCQACHSRTTDDRNGAPPGVDYDSLQDIRDGEARIRARVIDKGTMPLGGGVGDDELVLLEAFLDCGLDG